MNKELPIITETIEDLKHMLRHQSDGRKRERLQALYLLQTHQVSSRTEVARLLGVNRDTVGRWLRDYVEGGIGTLLDLYRPTGKNPTICGEILRGLEEKLSCPEGFGSYDEIRVWLEETYKVSLKYKTIYKVVRYKLGAKPKVARPSHIKKLSTNRAI
jgi:transposase